MRAVDTAHLYHRHIPAARRNLSVAVVTETYPPEINGVAITIRRVVQELRHRGHHVQLIRPRQGKGDAAVAETSYEEVLLTGISIPRYDSLKVGFPARNGLLRLWRRLRPDVVHVVTEGPLGWSAVAAATALGIPCSSDFHTNFHAYSAHYGIGLLRKPITSYLRKFHNKTQATLVPTASLLDQLRGHGFLNLRVVARGVDTRFFHPAMRSIALRARWHAHPRQPVAMYVGRLAPEKNLALLFNALRAIHALRSDVRLIVVGDGPGRAALEAAHPGVIFAGMRAGADLAAHYASADVFLFPSLTETFGNVTLEAMASGLAVVAYDYAAAHEYIEHGRSGLLASLGNEREFISLAAGLAGDGHRVAAIGHRARATAERFDWARVNDCFESALLDLVNARETGAANVAPIAA
jgi:glycosyltransferase involved in cell wall biosynthesis